MPRWLAAQVLSSVHFPAYRASVAQVLQSPVSPHLLHPPQKYTTTITLHLPVSYLCIALSRHLSLSLPSLSCTAPLSFFFTYPLFHFFFLVQCRCRRPLRVNHVNHLPLTRCRFRTVDRGGARYTVVTINIQSSQWRKSYHRSVLRGLWYRTIQLILLHRSKFSQPIEHKPSREPRELHRNATTHTDRRQHAGLHGIF